MREGERIGLSGGNGSGKSSLLAVIAGRARLDGGELRRRDGLRVALVEQEPELPPAASLRESLVARGALESIRDERERWRAEARLTEHLHRFGIDGELAPGEASGGEKKRAALALAFALEPDLVLLDEPTNHLDIDGIALLEQALAKGPAAIVVSHDRWFLDRFATRIVELDRGVLRSYEGNFSDYARVKEGEIAAEEVASRKFDKFWREEEAWIRKGIEARRTRNEGRVRRLERLRRERRLAADVGSGEEHRLDQLEIAFRAHALHQHRADHTPPANQTYSHHQTRPYSVSYNAATTALPIALQPTLLQLSV